MSIGEPAGAAQPLRFGRVAIVGCGLIGGSVAAALRARHLCARIIGHSPADAEEALALGLIDEHARTLEAAIEGAELVVLAAPVSVNAALMAPVGRGLDAKAVLTDVSSVKTAVVAAADARLGARRSRFVASHPIAGAETSGPAAASAALFEGRTVIVSRMPDSDSDAVATVERFWRALGATTLDLGVEAHDRVYAMVSHWPHAVAFGLARSVAKGLGAELRDSGATAGGLPPADALIGAGLRDTTRIAASDAALWADILLENAQPVLAAADAFRMEIAQFESAIARGDRDALVELIDAASRWRRDIGR